LNATSCHKQAEYGNILNNNQACVVTAIDNQKQTAQVTYPELTESVEEAVGNFDFDDTDNYSLDFHIDYDNRIAIESMNFHNADELLRVVYNEARELFAEIKEDDNQENQD
jgi:hypothetical protein